MAAFPHPERHMNGSQLSIAAKASRAPVTPKGQTSLAHLGDRSTPKSWGVASVAGRPFSSLGKRACGGHAQPPRVGGVAGRWTMAVGMLG
ncbi:MAG: hypothetical protein KGL39_30675 [Patescibacteria group bacterium]|nr:hypothetical protein [Patescibacteria group bacterium]